MVEIRLSLCFGLLVTCIFEKNSVDGTPLFEGLKEKLKNLNDRMEYVVHYRNIPTGKHVYQLRKPPLMIKFDPYIQAFKERCRELDNRMAEAIDPRIKHTGKYAYALTLPENLFQPKKTIQEAHSPSPVQNLYQDGSSMI